MRRLFALLIAGTAVSCGRRNHAPPAIDQQEHKVEASPALASAAEGRLSARPTLTEHPSVTARELIAKNRSPGSPGKSRLGLGRDRDGYVYAPKTYDASRPAPLVVFFHGAGGDAGAADMLVPLAEELGFVVLSIDARSSTWDVIVSEYGVDVAFLDRALRETFARYAIDEARIVAAGFSDGASYALSIGLTNGDLFDAIVAYSPGFMAPGDLHDKPRIFISHGDDDGVLPIDRCSRRLVPKLRAGGYDVTFDEFKGPHTVPPQIAAKGMRWALARH